MIRIIALAALMAAAFPGLAAAQEPTFACTSQQEIEQVLQSDGFVPEDCHEPRVNRIESAAGPICVLRFEARDPGVLDQITEAATTTQWWVSCDQLRPPQSQ